MLYVDSALSCPQPISTAAEPSQQSQAAATQTPAKQEVDSAAAEADSRAGQQQPEEDAPSNQDLTVKLPTITSGLAHPWIHPGLDQKVSVTLTLSATAAEDIGGVISAIADLLKIAVPPTYEITRTPSPEMFKMNLTRESQRGVGWGGVVFGFGFVSLSRARIYCVCAVPSKHQTGLYV